MKTSLWASFNSFFRRSVKLTGGTVLNQNGFKSNISNEAETLKEQIREVQNSSQSKYNPLNNGEYESRNVMFCTFFNNNTHWTRFCRLQNIQCHDCNEYDKKAVTQF